MTYSNSPPPSTLVDATRLTSSPLGRKVAPTEVFMSWSLFRRSPHYIGLYEVLARIGKGSYGSVFKGRPRDTGTFVPIKLLTETAARDAIQVKRFQQEILASRSLNEPHIVRGLDFGHEGTA